MHLKKISIYSVQVWIHPLNQNAANIMREVVLDTKLIMKEIGCNQNPFSIMWSDIRNNFTNNNGEQNMSSMLCPRAMGWLCNCHIILWPQRLTIWQVSSVCERKPHSALQTCQLRLCPYSYIVVVFPPHYFLFFLFFKLCRLFSRAEAFIRLSHFGLLQSLTKSPL